MEILVLILYGLALLLLFLYNCGQLSLIIIYLRTERKRKAAVASVTPILPADLPYVTVQLPVYNELYVVERLIDAVTLLKYPREKLDIQLLDDSSDETVDIIAAKVAYYKQRGLSIEHVRRPERTGFKAGALGYGLTPEGSSSPFSTQTLFPIRTFCSRLFRTSAILKLLLYRHAGSI
jgi:cellulose synthase/poly-beta-1,6-N-acetylglucosamine synthase-like glycosyltransferase